MQDELDRVTKKSHAEKVTIKDLQWLKHNMKGLSEDWIISSHKNEIKLQRAIKTKLNYNSALEELAIAFCVINNSCTMIQNTPHCVIIEDHIDLSNKINISTIKSISYKNISYHNIAATDELFCHIQSIEKNYSILKQTYHKKDFSKSVIADLKELASVEAENNNLNKASICNFMREQIEMINIRPTLRTYPLNSFSIACSLNLWNISSNYYECLRKSILFAMLPNRRTLFSINKKNVAPLDCIFSTDPQSIHCHILRKMQEYIAINSNSKCVSQKTIMALHLNEIGIQPKNSFSNKSIFLDQLTMRLMS